MVESFRMLASDLESALYECCAMSHRDPTPTSRCDRTLSGAAQLRPQDCCAGGARRAWILWN
ncbi:hypothetical protein WOLCODRAFT_135968 [Wolfiporia cocos MD-104 SS10]|uniref:Uncharacterized protein n=1 Tax=Wolfiporia cocos (strain MD-104) TaxID=742152 RepID=A0A2H3J6S9_WOLCO|nr:hypothetical protein WOLCODRAFT_135968 [Wolfiporia cocos MD-104 SS10]